MSKFKEQLKIIEEALLKPASDEDIEKRKHIVAQEWKKEIPAELFEQIKNGPYTSYENLKDSCIWKDGIKKLIEMSYTKLHSSFDNLKFILLNDETFEQFRNSEYDIWPKSNYIYYPQLVIRNNDNIKGIIFCSANFGTTKDSRFKFLAINKEQFLSQFDNIVEEALLKPASNDDIKNRNEFRIKEFITKLTKRATQNPDGSYDIVGNVYIGGENLLNFPIKFNKVNGDFYAFDNQLTSLKDGPVEVTGHFDVSVNKLTSLEYAPKKVGGNFDCSYNKGEFTILNVKSICDVKGRINVSR